MIGGADAAAERRASAQRLAAFVADDAPYVESYRCACARLLGRLEELNASPHASLARVLAQSAGIGDEELALTLGCLDVLQVGIDVADNLVDDRPTTPERYPAALLPTLTCLPALLVAEVVHRLHRSSEHGDYAAQRLLSVLSTMASGQAAEGMQKVAAVAGAQGLLVCLPLWTCGSSSDLQAVERWAWSLGEIWELRMQAFEEDTRSARARFRNALMHWTTQWPAQAPFRSGEPLAISPLLVAVGA